MTEPKAPAPKVGVVAAILLLVLLAGVASYYAGWLDADADAGSPVPASTSPNRRSPATPPSPMPSEGLRSPPKELAG